MYQPRHFDPDSAEAMYALLRAHPLGLLISPGEDGAPVVDPIPFLLDTGVDSPQSAQGTLVGHVARANPLWRLADGREVLVVFKGPDAYVSPGWYPAKAEHGKVVPTWNYAVVQAHGRLRAFDDAQAARRVVSRLTRLHESRRATPWALEDAPADYAAKMLQAIVAIEVVLTGLDGKFKLSQNRSAEDRAGVVDGLRDAAAGQPPAPGDPAALARWMAAVPGGPG